MTNVLDDLHEAFTERIVTDNGACYRAGARALLGSRQQRITPYTPRPSCPPTRRLGAAQ
jgi:hypothetical protein